MLRRWLGGAVVVLTAVTAAAEEPAWKRVLQGEDAQKAAQLQKRIAELEEADKYAEAVRLHEELLALRRVVQGAAHWETVGQRWALRAVQRVAALPAEERAGWRQAAREAAAAGRLEQQARYGEALALWQERLRWCRQVLGEDHPDTALSYNSIALNLHAQGKYAEAGPLYHKALAIRRQALGEEHPDTALSYNSVAYNLDAQGKYAEAGPLLQKALDIRRQALGEDHPDTAESYNNVAANLNAQGKYAEAAPLYHKALAIWRKALGEDHPHTAGSYNSVAANLHAQGKYAEAGPLFHKALAIRRQALGEDHPDTAASYNNVAANLNAQGKHAEAGPLFHKALDISRKVLGEDHPDTALSYNNVAANLDAQGKHAEAGPLYQKALAIRRKALGEGHPDTAGSYNNVAANLDDQGKHAEAGPLHQKALDIRHKVLGEDHPDTAGSYYNVAFNLDAQGKHAEAGRLFQKALAIRRQALGEDHPETAQSYNSVAYNLDTQGKYAEAGPLYQKALAIRRQALGEEHPLTAVSYNNVAANLNAQGKYAEAGPLYHKALAIRRQALGEEHPLTAESYNNVAANLDAQGKHAEAEQQWQRAVASFGVARLRLAPSGFDRAAATPMQPHTGLALCLARQNKHADAWQAAESGLARGLLDDLTLPADATDPRAAQRRQRATRLERLDALLLPLLTAEMLSTEQRMERDRLVGERDGLLAEAGAEAARLAAERVLPPADIQGQLATDAALVLWLDWSPGGKMVEAGGWHWGCVVRRSGPPAWVRLPGSGPGGDWTDADDQLPQRLREALARRALGWSELARRLRRQRLDPLEEHLGAGGDLPAVRHLIAVPAGWMAGVPLEALADRYLVSYAPSGTVLARLAAGHRPLRQPTLLALGDPTFTTPETPPAPEPPGHGLLILQVLPGGNADKAGLKPDDVLLEYAGTKLATRDDLKLRAEGDPVPLRLWRAGRTLGKEVAAGKLGIVVDTEPAPAALKRRHELNKLLASTRGPAPKPLPGTRREVQALAVLLPKDRVQLLLGSDASEQRLDQLATAGKLKDYRLLHFATHGALDAATPARSALLLATDRLADAEKQVREGKKVYTGRLTVGTVLGWKLDADLVTLSACETGLGRQAGGEGLLGFVQALVQAGARSVVVSLWAVDDAATALLMTRFYENLLGQREGLKAPLGKAEALAEAKQWLRSLPRAEAGALAAQLSKGEVRLTISPLKPAAPATAHDKGDRPYAHPYYWSAFVLLGDPD
jgi:tetratricopeptide (TPR) repeat protein